MSRDHNLEEFLSGKGFALRHLLGEGVAGRIYLIEKSNQKYALKLQKSDDTKKANHSHHKFHREALNLARLSHPGLPRIYELGQFEDSGYIVMEFVDAAAFRTRLKGRPLPEDDVRSFAIQIADALQCVHQAGLIHRDIKPENILVTLDGKYKLIDFSLAERDEELKSRREVAGSFNYCSPEQAGTLTLPVDGRTDLYSLGIILFECLAGRLPFSASSIPELLRKHAVEKIPSLRDYNPNVSEEMCAIVEKLMQKDPDDRFRTAHDLLLALDSKSLVKSSRQELIGRKDEMALLQRKLDLLPRGRGQMMLITGAAGAGKSRLFVELANKATERHLVVLKGKAVEGMTTSYLPFKNAIESWLLELSRDEERRAHVADALRGFLNDWSVHLKHLSIHFTRLFPEGQSREVRSSSEAPFEQVIFELFVQINKFIGPMLLVMDDVQWLDVESKNLLAKLAAASRGLRIFIALTARSEKEHHTVVENFVEDAGIQESDRIDLDAAPLGERDTEDFVRAAFGIEESNETTKTVAAKVYKVAKGNAFATAQNLRLIFDNAVVVPFWGKWTVKSTELDLLLSNDDVHALMNSRLSQVADSTRLMLSVAALMGSRFHPGFLARLMHAPSLAAEIEEAVAAEFLERRENDVHFAFIHDRVREAALELSDEKTKKQYHDQIARELRAQQGDPVEIAQHSLQGYVEQQTAQIYHDCLEAGIASLHRNAHQEAYSFLCEGLKYSHYAKPDFLFYQSLGEACAHVGQFEESKQHLRHALTICDRPTKRAYIRTQIAFSNFHLNDCVEAFQEISRGFGELNCNVTSSSPLAFFYSFIQLMAVIFIQLFHIGPSKNAKAREKYEVLCNMYLNLGMFAFTDLKMIPIIHAAQRGAYVRIRMGGRHNLAQLLATLAPALALMQLKKLAYSLQRKAEIIAKEVADPFLTSEIVAWKGIMLSFSGDETRSEVIHREVRRSHVRTVKADDYYHSLILLVYGLFNRGYGREAIEIARDALEVLKNQEIDAGASREYAIHMLSYMGIPCYSQIGMHAEAAALKKSCAEHIAKHGKNNVANCVFALSNLLYETQQEASDEVLESYIRLFKAQPVVLLTVPFHAKMFFVAQVQARLLQWRRAKGGAKEHFAKLLTKAFTELKIAGDRPLLKSYFWLYRGLWNMDCGKVSEALKDLARADDFARSCDNRLVLFEVARARGLHHLREGELIVAMMHYDTARMLAHKLGWSPLLATLETEFNQASMTFTTIVSANTSTHHAMTQSANHENANLVRYLDAFMKIGLASSEILDFKKHTQNVLDSLVEILHAERGLLFLGDESHLQFEAGRDSDKKTIENAENFSRSVIEGARQQGKPVLLASDGQGNIEQTESVIANEIRSVLAAPLHVAGKFVGVIYLDSRVAKGIFQMADAQVLQAVGQHFALSIQMARNAQLELEKKLLQKDIEVTEVVQSLFVPQVHRAQFGGVELSGYSKAASISGGDWWFYETLPSGVMRIILADVSGHGVGSAMVTGVIAGLFHALRHLDSGKFIEELNKHFSALVREKYWATLLVAEVGHGRVRWWNAGSPLFMILRDGKPISCVSPGASPLGLDDSLVIEPCEAPLEENDRILIFTDGCFDAALPKHGRLGLRKLRNVFTSVEGKGDLQDYHHAVIHELIGEENTQVALEDDITVIALEYKVTNTLSEAS